MKGYKTVKILAGCVLGLLLITGNAAALSFGDGGASLQAVLDNITVGPVAGNSSIDVATDYILDEYDSYWSIGGTGGALATMIIELAGYANINTFGVYNNGNYVELFSGAASTGNQALLSIKDDGSVIVNFADTGIDFSGNNFGFYLNSPEGIFHSDTTLNKDGIDHMAAYQGLGTDTVKISDFAAGLWLTNEFILAFEDLYGGGDKDYTDFVVMVESVTPAPEPATIMLLGLGMIGLAYAGRKKMIKK